MTKLSDKMLDLIPGVIYRLWSDHLSPFALKRKIKFFWQRLTRGWDDSETWSLDQTILKFIYPRLHRFAELTVCYPDGYKTLEDWKNELFKRSYQLKLLIDYSDTEYEYKSDEYEVTKDRMLAYYKDFDEWMNWFNNNIGHLWW